MDMHRDEALTKGLSGGNLSRRGALGRLGGAGAAALAAAAGVQPVRGQEAGAGDAAGGRFPGDAGEAPGTPAELVAPPLLFEELPAFEDGPAGRLRRLTDYDRNLWLDAGEGWRSVGGHVFDVQAYGATGDGVTDDWGAFAAAIEAMVSPLDPDSTSPAGRTLLVPPGRYRLGQSLVLTRAVRLVGAVGSGPIGDAVLVPDPGITAIVVEGSEAPVRGRPGRRGFGATIERLLIVAGGEGTAGGARENAVHGVLLRARATLRDCAVVGFSGDGIHGADAGGEIAEVDRWAIDGCQVVNCGEHGLYVGGGSAGVCSGLLAFENRKWGIFEESEGGNTYLHCRAIGNGQGPFFTAAGNPSLFAGCAATAGQARSLFADDTIVVAGDHAAGYEGGNTWVAAESRMLLRAQEPGADAGDGDGGQPLATVPTLHLVGAPGQTEPHLRLSEPGGERVAEFTAAGRLLVGPAPLTPPPGGGPDAPDAIGLEPVQVQISHPASGQAAVRWVVAGEFAGWVAQARAIVDLVGEGEADAAPATSRLTFQTPDAAGGEIDTLTLRQGRVGIGTSVPAPAAVLELESATQGFLPPRLTIEQRDGIVAPPEGLTIYNRTTRRLNVFDGEAWRELALAAVGG